MTCARVFLTRVDIHKNLQRERPVAAKSILQQLQEELRVLEFEVEEGHGLRPLEVP
jgi:hypothetical protein